MSIFSNVSNGFFRHQICCLECLKFGDRSIISLSHVCLLIKVFTLFKRIRLLIPSVINHIFTPLQITFMKRKLGLFRKAYQLSVLCDCQISVIIMPKNNKLFQYSSSDMNSILQKYVSHPHPDEALTNEDMSKVSCCCCFCLQIVYKQANIDK